MADNWSVLQTFREKGRALDVDAARRLIFGAMQHHLSPEDLGRIRARTLVTVGEHDVLTPPYLACEIAEGIAGAAYAELPGLGHAAALEDVAAFCRQCRAYLVD